MTFRPVSRVLLAVVCVGLVAGGFVWALAARDTSAGSKGWKTIEHESVEVDVPASWVRTDMDDCEFQFEHWGPSSSADCGRHGGVAFYASSTFDPAHGPGVRRTEPRDSDEPPWAGYVIAGDVAVYASDDDLALVRKVLRSAT